MASNGTTKLLGVNRMLRWVGERNVSALDTGGVSIQADAERVLDDVTLRVLARGYDENTRLSVALTASAGAIAVPSGVIHLRAAGASHYRRFSIRNTSVFDMEAYSASFGTSEVIYCDLIYTLTFEECSQRLKDLICDEACVAFQQIYRGSPEKDGYTKENLLKSEVASVRAPAMPPPFNQIPPGVGLAQGQSQ